LLAEVLCELSKGLFSLTKGLLLLKEVRSFFSEHVSPMSERLSLESKPRRLEPKRLFVESERLLRERTGRSRTNLIAPIYSSVEGAISSDRGGRFSEPRVPASHAGTLQTGGACCRLRDRCLFTRGGPFPRESIMGPRRWIKFRCRSPEPRTCDRSVHRRNIPQAASPVAPHAARCAR